MINSLHSLSPLDGRYADATAPLRDHFSEFAFLRDRVRVELDLLAAFSKIGLRRPLTDPERALIHSIQTDFSPTDAKSIQRHESKTRHDVKAIEYFLQDKLRDTSLKDAIPWIHFGLTSEDVNNLALAIALKESRDKVILPNLQLLITNLCSFAKLTRAISMLARTHGQFAVPTTLGKEIAVFIDRLKKNCDDISAFHFEAKLTGAVGNFNALRSAAPNVDWLAFSRDFVTRYGLRPNLVTTQILPYDNWIRYFDLLRLTNSILIDFSQDVWRYVSDGTLKQAVIEGEVGSSTMPQKVNPIDFENAEGNLGLANALFIHYSQKLTVSRLQRDLSDSTVRRTFGVALGNCLLAYVSMTRGMTRIAPDEEKLKAELNAHWEAVAEGAQTILRAAGRDDAYESLKRQTRGRVLTEAVYRSWYDAISVDDETREKLKALSPESYLGLAVELTDSVIASTCGASTRSGRSRSAR